MNTSKVTPTKKIWIDMDNSPHVPFFYPIVAELKKRGCEVLITARSCFQVCELADRLNMQYKLIGHHHGKYKIIKLFGLFFRAIQLLPTIIKEKPILALSHGSRAQLISSKILGIPTVSILDYEYSKNIPFINSTWLISPKIIIENNECLKKERILSYPGIKEDIYVPNFKPDPSIIEDLGIKEEALVITIRPPATEAHYHNPQSEILFKEAIDFLCSKPNSQLIILPRTDKQKTFIKKRWPKWSSNGKIIFPNHVVDGLNLIWHSDLVISGGGTMNREAAALKIPVYSIFRGKIGVIDQYLSCTGRLILIENVEDIYNKIVLAKRHRQPKPKYSNPGSLKKLVDRLIWITDNLSK